MIYERHQGLDLAALPVGVLAFSQGAATGARWLAHRHQHGLAVPGRLVVWGGALPHDFDLGGADGDALRATRLTLVVGEADEFATAEVVAEQPGGRRKRALATRCSGRR